MVVAGKVAAQHCASGGVDEYHRHFAVDAVKTYGYHRCCRVGVDTYVDVARGVDTFGCLEIGYKRAVGGHRKGVGVLCRVVAPVGECAVASCWHCGQGGGAAVGVGAATGDVA